MARNRPRVRSIPNILEEIRSLYVGYNVTAIRFVDDMLLGNIPFVRAFTTTFIDSGLKAQVGMAGKSACQFSLECS